MRKKLIFFMVLVILSTSLLYAQGDKEIANIREIVEVKRSIFIPKDPVISALLAVQYPGLGQVYCGKYWRAAGIFIGEIALIGGGITLRGEKEEDFTYAVIDSAEGDTVYLKGKRTIITDKTDRDKMIGNTLIIGAVAVHIWQIFDAYHQANVHNRDMIKRAKKETGLNLKLKRDGIGLAYYMNF